MKCAGGCGREIGRSQTYCSPACRTRVDEGKAWARDVARRADERPAARLVELKCSPQEQRLIAVLRAAGSRGATTAELAQAEVCGVSAAKRVYDARHKRGFEIDVEQERRGSYRYRLLAEPGSATTPLPTPVTSTVGSDAGGSPNLLRISSAAYGPYDDFDEAA